MKTHKGEYYFTLAWTPVYCQSLTKWFQFQADDIWWNKTIFLEMYPTLIQSLYPNREVWDTEDGYNGLLLSHTYSGILPLPTGNLLFQWLALGLANCELPKHTAKLSTQLFVMPSLHCLSGLHHFAKSRAFQ